MPESVETIEARLRLENPFLRPDQYLRAAKFLHDKQIYEEQQAFDQEVLAHREALVLRKESDEQAFARRKAWAKSSRATLKSDLAILADSPSPSRVRGVATRNAEITKEIVEILIEVGIVPRPDNAS